MPHFLGRVHTTERVKGSLRTTICYGILRLSLGSPLPKSARVSHPATKSEPKLLVCSKKMTRSVCCVVALLSPFRFLGPIPDAASLFTRSSVREPIVEGLRVSPSPLFHTPLPSKPFLLSASSSFRVTSLWRATTDGASKQTRNERDI